MTCGTPYKFTLVNESIIRSSWEIGHNFVLKNPNQVKPMHLKDDSVGYFRAKFHILKIKNHKDNSVSISSSSKARKRCVFFRIT